MSSAVGTCIDRYRAGIALRRSALIRILRRDFRGASLVTNATAGSPSASALRNASYSTS
jgi:hypothetical protein